MPISAKVKDYYYHQDEYNPDEPYEERYDYPAIELDIYYGGTRIGNLSTGVFGDLHGDLGKRGIRLDDVYEIKPEQDEIDPSHIDVNAWEEYVTQVVTRYFTKWKTGRAHLELIRRQFDLSEKEELEEIKVTKTLAKKRTTPMKDMATKEKMTRKKKGKDGKIKKDAKKPMNRNVHDLANITLKGEYRS